MLKYLFVKPAGVSSDRRWLDVPQDAEVFTYHQKHAGQALLGGLILAAIVEAAGVHLLISMWNHWVALAATLATAWFGLQVIAQIRAMGMRPIYIDQGHLILRNGAFDLADIAISQVDSIEKSIKKCVQVLKKTDEQAHLSRSKHAKQHRRPAKHGGSHP